MSSNPANPCQNVSLSAECRARAAGRQGGNSPRSVKKRARELSVRNISPPRHPFSCGKNGISLLKEISVLPQSRRFLAAKPFPGVWKAGKNGASGGIFLPDGGRPRAKSICHFAIPPPPAWLTQGHRPSAWCHLAEGKVPLKGGFRLSSCILVDLRESRISARPRPCARPHDSRGAGFDVLTE